MKSFLIGFLATIAILLAAAIGYAKLGLTKVRADVPTPTWQDWIIHFAEHASVRRPAAQLRNPFPDSDTELIAGGRLYLDGCAGCHGTPGGPARKHLEFLSPTEFARVGTKYSESESFWVIRHGLRRTGMSAYGSFYSERQLWQLAAFVVRMNSLPPSVLHAIQPAKP